MPIFIMLTRLSPVAARSQDDLKPLERKVMAAVEEHCPGVH
jgi:hypothetical protein